MCSLNISLYIFHFQMSTEASSSSNVAAAANEPQPTVIANEPQPTVIVNEPRPIVVADEPQQKSTSRRPRGKIYYFPRTSTPPDFKVQIKKTTF
jgi:hypothetical protein